MRAASCSPSTGRNRHPADKIHTVAGEFTIENERDALADFLDRQRDALIRTVRGASDADARQAPTASSLSLLGLLKHSAVWEARWFPGHRRRAPIA